MKRLRLTKYSDKDWQKICEQYEKGAFRQIKPIISVSKKIKSSNKKIIKRIEDYLKIVLK